ncbi:MAG TPA: rhodanese-like domain-containing protein [Tenuifilaceae bacterium]|nr:rhodanese-like domain-containing protein [Tenuifilaceae bacterium]HPJ46227.1 rhodanese-like domain-containing protein [Tenuifilaceae bacterium]HPQ33849.1 rhodanese-like domain-containing protein [Tenuifilaceae bacterium]
MKRFFKYALLVALVPAIFLTSCKEENEPTPERQTDVEFQTLKTYLIDQNLDLDDILTDWVIPASSVNADLANFYVIDIRSADAFNTSHIPGAVNSTFANILTAAEGASGKTIVVACYTGQTAGHAVAALRLSGYPTAKVLKWGMSGWSSTLDSWSNNTHTLDHANWIAAPGATIDNTTEYNDPDITETGTGAEILAARVALLLSGSLRGVNATDVLDSPANYFINNYWASTDVETYGNIGGAYRINPLTLGAESFKYLDPSKNVVTYCWTGQTSSVITAYLYVIGYNSNSLKFGANSMIYDNLAAGGTKWAAVTTDLPLE